VHVPIQENSEDSISSVYEKLEEVFNHFPKCHMKILLGDFNAKLRRGDILKPTFEMRVYISIVVITVLE
jgi:hypothetical protein